MDFVSFELGKKLKEKGFNWKVNAYYGIHENRFNVHPAKDMNDCEYRCSAPTISQVLKWLREHKIHILIEYVFSETSEYSCEVQIIDSYERFYPDGDFGTYEEAALAGIEYVLENLI